MKFIESKLKGCFLIQWEPKSDNRGWFARTFCETEFEEIGLNINWRQINFSHTNYKGTVRGLHFQNTPNQEVKLIHCIRGKVLDVVVDLRKDSLSFLQAISNVLSEDNHYMIYIPKGLAHGFQSLEDNSELIYHHSEFYSPTAESGVNVNDPVFQIEWPLDPIHISNRDLGFPFLDYNFQGI